MINEFKSVRIVDINGNELDKSHYTITQSDKMCLVKINEINSGIYFVDFELNSGSRLHTKLMYLK